MSTAATGTRGWFALLCAAVVLLGAWQVSEAQSSTPVITTIAGGGNSSGNGDGGAATDARLNNVQQIAIDAAGNLYLAETYGFRVRKVTAAGVISTLAGNGDQLYNGDNIPATSAAMDVRGVAVDAAGNVYIADGANHRIRKVGVNGIITSIATAVEFPTGLAVSPTGVLHFIDGSRVRKIGPGGVIQAVAGTVYGFGGDNGPATSALLANPAGIAFDPAGNLYIADYGNDRIRKVSLGGIITTLAGGGPFRSDPVILSTKITVQSVAADARGNIYIAERGNIVRIVNAQGITRVAAGVFNDTTFGTVGAHPGFSGDGGPALEASMNQPVSLALDAQENLYIADTGNGRIRKVTPIPTPITPQGIDAFSAYTSTLVGSFTQHVAVADVTGDGRDDALLTTTTWSGPYAEPENDFRLLLFVQKPDGSLAPPLKYPYFGDPVGGRSGTGLATADLNNDGFADVVVGTLKGITVYLGNTAGLSAGVEHAAVPNAEATLQLAIMDVNRDTYLDVVTFSAGRAEGGSSPTDQVGLLVYYGNGAGGIASRRFQPRADELGWKFLRAKDINRDGILDLTSTWTGAIAGIASGGAEVTLHDGVSGFLATTRMRASTPAWWGAAYAFGDFNSDGLVDAVVSVPGNAPQAAYSLFNQQAGNQFAEVRNWRSYDSPDDMISADMNGDGRDDLLVVHGGWSSIGYHPQTDSGLGEEIKYYVRQSGNPRFPSIAVGDLNKDGCKDVAMADYNYGLIILRGRNCLIRYSTWGSHPLIPLHSQPGIPPSQSSTAGTGNTGAPSPGTGTTRAPGVGRSPDIGGRIRLAVRAMMAWLWQPLPLLLMLGSAIGLGWIIRTRVR